MTDRKYDALGIALAAVIVIVTWPLDAIAAESPDAAAAPPDATVFEITSAPPMPISKTAVFSGRTGSAWVNVTAWNHATGKKVAPDATPAGNKFTSDINTTLFAPGSGSIDFIAHSVPSNYPGGVSQTINYPVTVAELAPPITGQPPGEESFTLGGITFTIGAQSFSTSFPSADSLSRIAGNVKTASSAYDWYSSQNINGPGFGAIICCGWGISGKGNANYDPYSWISGGGVSLTYKSGGGGALMQTIAQDGTGFTQLGGYWEATAQMPPSQDTWPAWWVVNGLNNWTVHLPGQTGEYYEDDIFEIYPGATPNCGGFTSQIVNATLHKWGQNGANHAEKGHSAYNAGFDTSAAYHKYGMLWTRETISFYIDRNPTPFATMPTPTNNHQAGFGIINLGGNACGRGQSTPSPQSFLIKSVDIWPLPNAY